MEISILILLVCLMGTIGEITRENMLGAKYYDGKKITLPIDNDATDELMSNWLNQALSGFMAAYGSKKSENLSERHKKRLQTCSKAANTLKKHARCVIDIMYSPASKYQDNSAEESQQKHKWIQDKLKSENASKGIITLPPFNYPNMKSIPENTLKRFNRYRGKSEQRAKNQWTGSFLVSNKNDNFEKEIDEFESRPDEEESFRAKRAVSKNNYKLLSDSIADTPLGSIIKIVSKAVRKLKKKPNRKSWRITLSELKNLGNDMDAQYNSRKTMDMKVAGLAKAQMENAPLEDRRKINNMPKQLGGVEYMLENLLKQKDQKKNKKMSAAMKLFREAIKLSMILTGSNVTNFDKRTIKLASPRIMPIVPNAQEDEEINILSPSLFSLHDESRGLEKNFSIAGMLKAASLLKDHEQDELMNLIMEVTGVMDAVDKLYVKKEAASNETILSVRGIDNQPLYFTKENVSETYGDEEVRKVEVFERLHETYTDDQNHQLNTTGFALLKPEQMDMIYGENSPYRDPIALERLRNLKDDEHLQRLVESDIVKFSKANKVSMNVRKIRNKRQAVVLMPQLLVNLNLMPGLLSNAIVLSPLVLVSAILSPAVLGPFILSPWVFVALILSPRVLSPFVLSPIVLSPIILCPLVLHPFILTPGVLVPIILTPFLLSPLILTPLAGVPIILSPLCLSPLILAPGTLTTLSLSPFVLSPLILSSQYIFSLYLSPYAYSPLIMTNLTASAVVASPSFMS